MTTRLLRAKLEKGGDEYISSYSWLDIINTLKIDECPEPKSDLKIEIIKYWIEHKDKKVLRDYAISHGYFTVEQYVKYKEANIQNWNINSLSHCIARFGEPFATIYHKEHIDRRKKTQASFYTVEYWVSKGFTIEEAETQLSKFRAKTCGDRRELFANKYGEELGAIKFKEFQDKSKHTEEKYIERFGEEGKQKFAELCAKRDSNSDTHFQSKYGDDWQTHRDARRESTRIDLDRYIDAYGSEEGERKYRELVKTRLNHSFAKGQATNESLVAFQPILSFCDENQIPYHVGSSGSSEYGLFDEVNKKFYYYDLVIPSLKLVFEYNGVHVHPNPNWSQEKLNGWRCPYRGISAKTAFAYDASKAELIKRKRDFDVVCIYSDAYRESKSDIDLQNLKLISNRREQYEDQKH